MKRFTVLCVSAALTFVVGSASGVTLPFTLGANPDGVRDTANPCVDGVTNCRAPGPSVLACADPTPASLSGLQTGTPYSENARTKFSGLSAATATLSVVTDSGTDATANGWAISSAGAGNNLTNGGSNLGSGSLHVRGTIAGPHSVDCPIRNWSWVAPPSTDTTPPTPVTGLHLDSVGSLSVTLSADASIDPDDAVARTGVASYKFYRNGTLVDTLTAATPGLVCDFTPTAIGTVGGSPSATQGSGASGAQWTVVGGGYGVENATPDSYYGTFCPVSGSSIYLVDRVDSIPNTLTYNKSHSDARNSSSATAAHYDCVIFRSGSTYFMQRTKRGSDGGTNVSGSAVALPGAPPYYRRKIVANNLGECDYSTDGGTWTTFVSSDPITLNDSKIDGVGASATSSGSDSAAITIPYGSVAVQTAGRVSKTITVVAGTATFTATATDVQGNENTAVGSVSGTPNSPSTFKWNPGHYVQTRGSNRYRTTASDSARHSDYTIFLGQANVTGVNIWVYWKNLESDAGNDFSSGITWLQGEIAFIKATYPGKHVMLTMFTSDFGHGTSDATQRGVFPNYFVDAGCPAIEGNSNSIVFKMHSPTCRGYLKRMIAAYGAVFDSEPLFEAIRTDQETDYGYFTPAGQGWDANAIDTGWRDVALAARTAFPTTNVIIPLNNPEVWTNAQMEVQIQYFKSINVAVGAPDTCGYSVSPVCNVAGNISITRTLRGIAGAGTSGHDYCGEIAVLQSVELSEMGYNSQPPHPNGYTSQQVADTWNADYCASHGIWEFNNNEIGNANQKWAGANGQLATINSTPMTHTTKPASYP